METYRKKQTERQKKYVMFHEVSFRDVDYRAGAIVLASQ